MSWIVTFPSGKVGETFDESTAATARRMGMKVEPIREYLARINAAIRDEDESEGCGGDAVLDRNVP